MITVTLRKREGKNGKTLLYLDFYPPLLNPVTMRKKRREYLHMSIYTALKNNIQKEYNRQPLEMAESIRCKRSLDISNDDLGIYLSVVSLNTEDS